MVRRANQVHINTIWVRGGPLWPGRPKPVWHFHRNRDRLTKIHDFVPFNTWQVPGKPFLDFFLEIFEKSNIENFRGSSSMSRKSEKLKKFFFFNFLIFHLMLEDPQNFWWSIFRQFQKNKSKNGFSGTCQVLKGTKSWILVSLFLFLWKRQIGLGRPGHNAPPLPKIGLTDAIF